jgi:hypothetical protein
MTVGTRPRIRFVSLQNLYYSVISGTSHIRQINHVCWQPPRPNSWAQGSRGPEPGELRFVMSQLFSCWPPKMRSLSMASGASCTTPWWGEIWVWGCTGVAEGRGGAQPETEAHRGTSPSKAGSWCSWSPLSASQTSRSPSVGPHRPRWRSGSGWTAHAVFQWLQSWWVRMRLSQSSSVGRKQATGTKPRKMLRLAVLATCSSWFSWYIAHTEIWCCTVLVFN